MSQEQIIVGCDWKNPADLVRGLIKGLPKLGLFAYEASGAYTVIISKIELSKEEVNEILNGR